MFAKQVMGALVSGGILAMTMNASPALACQGTTVLFKDDFNKVDKAWTKPRNFNGQFSIGGGKLVAKSPADEWLQIAYGAKVFPEADLCVDVVVSDEGDGYAGIGFKGSDAYYVAGIQFDGQVIVNAQTYGPDGTWLTPLPASENPAVKTGRGAVNRIRLVWKAPPPKGSNAKPDPTVSFYVNDKLIDTFDADPNANRMIAFGLETSGATVEFRNLVVTK